MGDFLTRPNKTKNSEDDENERIRWAASDMQGWRKRQEDSHITSMNIGKNKDIELFGVFDGHGGKEVAQWVKKHFVPALEENANFIAGKYKEALEETFLYMDELMTTKENKEELKILNKLSREEGGSGNQNMDIFKQIFEQNKGAVGDIAMGTGCTAIVALISKDTLYFANAGDSRAVLSKNGVAYPMSTDHKPENDEEKARVYKADGFVVDGRIKGNLNLSRSLGDLEFKVPKNFHPKEYMITAFPEVTSCKLSSDCDFIILGCDGIWDCKKNQEAVDFVQKRINSSKYEKLSPIIEELFEDCIAEDIYNG